MEDRTFYTFDGRANCIVTARLAIAPLTRQETELYLTDVEEYARVMKLSEVPIEPDPDTRDALNWLIDVGLRLDSYSYVWGAVWALVDRATSTLVGNASFKGEPIDGYPEIGYGTELPYRNKGYMTEAVRAFVEWGRTRPEIRGIIAETLRDNPASQRVLINSGFEPYNERQSDEGVFWRIDYGKSDALLEK